MQDHFTLKMEAEWPSETFVSEHGFRNPAYHDRSTVSDSMQRGTCSDKGKALPVLLIEHDAMKAYFGSGGISPLIL
jgi:hypothetical protein